MPEVYLLDTNVVLDAILPETHRPNRRAVLAKLEALKTTEAKIALPVIAMAEVEFGLAKQDSPEQREIEAIRAFWRKHPLHVPIDDGTIEPYALIRGEVFRRYATARARGRTYREKLPENLCDRVTGKELGIDERDLLIASVAAQYNYVLVTNDEGGSMTRLKEAADSLRSKGLQLRLERWS
ncbi:type II toxin-antitoxin system VapC family toxin [Candidatus Sumerlaeota bacterium]|nr:type II toxin-antitoxin system VapC family toxin [Candidatus Sumerlaeota bacterium]